MISEFNSFVSSNNLNLKIAEEELSFIKEVRNAGISKEMVSDEIVASVSSYSLANIHKITTADTPYKFKHQLTGKEVDTSQINLIPYQNGNEEREYLDTTPLKKRISQLNSEISRETIKRDRANKFVDSWFQNQVDYEAQKRDKQHEIDKLKVELALLESKDIDKIKKEIRDTYKDEGRSNTRPEIDMILKLLKRVENLEKISQKANGQAQVGLVDEDLKDIRTKLETLNNNIGDHEKLIARFGTYGKTAEERALNKKLDSNDLTVFKNALDAAKGLRKLSETERLNLEAIDKKLKGELKDKDEDTKTDLDGSRLLTLLGVKAGTQESELKLSD
ncbi:MAG: hypothetical protein NY202_02140 [Mollicutes bacterium UO1]